MGFRLLYYERSLRFDSSEDIADDDDLWTDLESSDWGHIGVTAFYQLIVFVAVVHLWRQRTWPPYCVRQISLVCLAGLVGIIAYFGALVAAGAIDRHDGDLVAHCGLDSLFHYTAWGVWVSVALVRVYRSWKILVKHSVEMWPQWAQVALLTIPWCTPAVVYSIDEELALFNERRNWCEVYEPVDTAMYVLRCVPIAVAFVLVFQMRKVRKQMNEYRLQVFQLTFLLLSGSVLFPLQHVWLDNRHEVRRIWVLYENILDSLLLFWPPIAVPIYRYIQGDTEYLYSYTKGFSTLPTPAQMKSSLRDQLALDDLRAEFEKFAESRVARELPDFYRECLDRDEIVDFFGRQAATSAIIDRFIRVGSEQEINLSDRIRQKILSTAITSYNIFNEAMSAVLVMMDGNFSAAFKRTEGYKKLEKHVQDEAEELERLRKMKQLPEVDCVQSEPTGLLRLLRNALPAPESAGPRGSSAGGSGSSCGVADGRLGSTTSSNHSGTTGRTSSLRLSTSNGNRLSGRGLGIGRGAGAGGGSRVADDSGV